jgi:putative aldouronate transport system substrate-binding protein
VKAKFIIRIITCVLLAAMIFSTTACTKQQSASQQDGTQSKTTEKGGNVPDPTQTKDTGKKVTLSVVVQNNVESFLPGDNENKNAIIDFLKEGTGFNFNWIILPKDQPTEKLNMMMASGDDLDVVRLVDKNLFGAYLSQTALAPLDEYIPNCPNMKKFIPDETWAPVTWQGKIYAVGIPASYEASSSVVVRQDWLEELGLKEPVSLEDYQNTLTTLTQKTEYPFSCVGLSVVGGFAGAFGLGTTYAVKNDKVVYTYIEPEAKEYIAYMKKLYKENLIDPECPINKDASLKEKIINNKVGMTVLGWAGMLPIDNDFKVKVPNGKLKVIAPPVGANGKSGFQKTPPLYCMLSVPAKSKHKEEAMQFLDFMCKEEVHSFISFGKEGEHFVKENGEIKLTPEYQNWRWQMYYVLVDTPAAFAVRCRDKGFKPYFDEMVPYATLRDISQLAPPYKEVSSIASDLWKVTEEYFMKMITDEMPIEEFNKFVEQWKARKGEEALKVLNDWYANEYKK